MWTLRNPTNDVVELYELANKRIMWWLKTYGFPEIKLKPHTQMDEWYEPRLFRCLNRPEENEYDEDEKKQMEEERKERADRDLAIQRMQEQSSLNETTDELKNDQA